MAKGQLKGKKLDNVGHILDSKIEEKFNASIKEWRVEVEEMKEKGLDIEDIESIKAFDIEYTPIGSTIIVKELKNDEKFGSIIIPDIAKEVRRGVVIETGLYAHELRKGDIVAYKHNVKDHNFRDVEFKHIKFHEIDIDAVSGVYLKKQEVVERLKN